MASYSEFGGSNVPAKPLSKPEKAAAILLAMGKPVAGKLLKFFEQSELQTLIARAQMLRSVPPDELAELVAEFEELFTEGAGLMDNAKAMEGILEEGLTPDEVDGLLGRRNTYLSDETTVWERLQKADPELVGSFLAGESLQTCAFIVSKLPPRFAGAVMMTLPSEMRAKILHRSLNMKSVGSRIAEIVERRVAEIVASVEAERNQGGTDRVAEMMNELDKNEVDSLLGALETISKTDADKVRPKIFLFEDLLLMPLKSRITLFNDLSSEVITTALRGASQPLCEAVLSSIGARQRRMIESDLAGDFTGTERDIAVARRSIAQEAIRLAGTGKLVLKELEAPAAAA
jgi:flagellar motor switch protein FliG